jgi:hypothetical protein
MHYWTRSTGLPAGHASCNKTCRNSRLIQHRLNKKKDA